MKTIIMLALFLFAHIAIAAPIQFNFDRVELTQFLSTTYGDALKKNFVIAPQLLNESKKISLHVDIERDKLPQFLDEYLQRLGIGAQEKDGIVYLSSAASAPAPTPAPVGGADAAQMLPLPAGTPNAQGEVIAGPGQVPIPLPDKEVRMFRPEHRDADFMVAIMNAAFGANTAIRAGSQLVISASKSRIDKAMTLASDIDVAPAKVTVSATFVEVSSTDGKSHGFSLIATVLGAKLGAAIGSTDTGSILSIKTASFEAVVNALDSDGRFKQVSNPRVSVDDYEKTTISVGDETPTVSGTSLDSSGHQIQQVVYRSSGVILDVQPKVLGDGKIQMTIDGQVSSFQATTTGVNKRAGRDSRKIC